MAARRLLLVLPLAIAACAGRPPAAPAPAARYAAALDQADEVAEQVFQRIDGYERRVVREGAAIGFALNTRSAGGQPAVAAAGAGEVLSAGMSALAAHAERLEAGATGERPQIEEGGELLDDAAIAGLTRLQQAGIVVPEAERQAGLAGIAALARGPGGDPRRATAAALAQPAEPQVRAVTALMRRVVGTDAGGGVRGLLRTQRAGLDANEAQFLAAVRRDRTLGVAQRYALVRDLAEAREGDPLPGTFDALLAVIGSAEAAHTAIAAGGGSAEVAALEGAVARLAAYGGAPSRE